MHAVSRVQELFHGAVSFDPHRRRGRAGRRLDFRSSDSWIAQQLQGMRPFGHGAFGPACERRGGFVEVLELYRIVHNIVAGHRAAGGVVRLQQALAAEVWMW